ncbi:PDR/VanB family oxidoreductase [Castellaniella sp. FW104-16D08]|uniref:PDR/VanB family oxidoreductase n=1 Tax=unclassified Castellaniella TaxID=2617606 RepID=UPI003314A9D2
MVRQVRYEGVGIHSFELVHPQGQVLPAFTAGAHIDVHVPGGFVRQYSLCNDPAERHRYLIAVLRDEHGRGGSRQLHAALTVSSSVTVSQPRNQFRLDDTARTVILLAGGIGITPLKSMVHTLQRQGRDFMLHYCAKDLEHLAFRDTMTALEQAGQASFHFDGGDPKNGLDIAGLLRAPAPGTALYYCGPGGFMQACAAAAQHWPKGSVHCEHFKAPEPSPILSAARAPGSFQIQIASTGRLIAVPADESIATALEKAGIAIETSCLSGLCGTCRIRYLEGEVEHNDFILDEDERAHYLTACVSRCHSERLVLDL